MSTIADLNGNLLGTPLQNLLMADAIVPGAAAGYEVCKIIYLYHPHGQKIVDFPIQMAQSRGRKITIPKAPDDGEALVEAFMGEWKKLRFDNHIANLGRQARIYGVSTMGLLTKDVASTEPVGYEALSEATIAFNIWDPLNTAGSLVLSQDPNSMDFQKPPSSVVVNGVAYHRSRTVVLMNEDPIYISYTSSGFGFLGRSVYQRGLAALKSFIASMATDNMVVTKAGLLIAKMKSQSSAVDGPMAFLFGGKRQLLKEARTGNVLSIDVEEAIETLNMQNLDGAYSLARKNIIENEAAGCGTPAKILLAETFAEGFGEGTEDAKAIAQFIEGVRTWLDPAYVWADQITMYRAWNPAFFEMMQARYPERYAGYTYARAFLEWRNSFTATWPSLIEEPESEKIKVAEVILKAVIAVVEVLLPACDPVNKAIIVGWLADNLNEMKRLITSPLELDLEALENYEPPTPEKLVDPAPPESSRDSAVSRLKEAVGPENIAEVDAMVRQIAGLIEDKPRLAVVR